MSTRVKVGIGVLAVAVLLAVAAVPWSNRVMTRRYERLIVDGVKQRYGGELELDNFKVDLLSSRATVDGYRYADPEDSTYRVTLTGGPVVVDIEALAWRPERVRFREVVLESPELTLVRTPRGDWDQGIPGVARDLVEAGIEKAKKALGLGDFEVRKGQEPGVALEVHERSRILEFGKVVIRDGKVVYEDHRFTDTPIKLTLRDFDFEGSDISGADLWRTLLTSEADGILAIGSQEIEVTTKTRTLEGEEKQVWTLLARGVKLAPLLGPILEPMYLDLKEGEMDLQISHHFDLSVSQRSAIILDYRLTATGLVMELRDAGRLAFLREPAERIADYVQEHGGEVELAFSVEAAPDLALLGQEAGSVLEVVGRLTLEALRRKLFEAAGLSGLLEE